MLRRLCENNPISRLACAFWLSRLLGRADAGGRGAGRVVTPGRADAGSRAPGRGAGRGLGGRATNSLI